MTNRFTYALAFLACVQAKIVDDGPWTNKDWFDATTKIGVKNGIPYSTDDAEKRRIETPLGVDGEPVNWENSETV